MDIKEIRQITRLSQREFSLFFGIPIGTLRNWEQGIAKPPEYVFNMIFASLRRDKMINVETIKFIRMLDELAEDRTRVTNQTLEAKVAMMSCKAAVKGNQKLSFPEAEALLAELLTLDNPYACPHGRPTLISMTRSDLEKRFRRIV